MPKTSVDETVPEYGLEDLPELETKLAGLLRVQHSDGRSLRELKRDMLARGKEISALSDLIEELEDRILDVPSHAG